MTGEGGGKPKIVTNGDKGGRGVKKSHFCGDVIFERPLKISGQIIYHCPAPQLDLTPRTGTFQESSINQRLFVGFNVRAAFAYIMQVDCFYITFVFIPNVLLLGDFFSRVINIRQGVEIPP